MSEGPYSRVYWQFRDEFAAIYADKEAFGWWVTLLVIAEGSYPSAGDLPRRVPETVLAKLRDAGLITFVGDDGYRVRGLDQERKRRSSAASNAAQQRWNNAKGMRSHTRAGMRNRSGEDAKGMPSRAKQEQEQRESEDVQYSGGYSNGNDAAPAKISPDIGALQRLAEELTGKPYVMANIWGGLGEKVVTEQLPHGLETVERAWRWVASKTKTNPTFRQLVLGADDVLNPIVRSDPKARQDQQAQADFDRRVERTRKATEEYRQWTEGQG